MKSYIHPAMNVVEAYLFALYRCTQLGFERMGPDGISPGSAAVFSKLAQTIDELPQQFIGELCQWYDDSGVSIETDLPEVRLTRFQLENLIQCVVAQVAVVAENHPDYTWNCFVEGPVGRDWSLAF